jgi:hypothetical protein
MPTDYAEAKRRVEQIAAAKLQQRKKLAALPFIEKARLVLVGAANMKALKAGRQAPRSGSTECLLRHQG